MNALQSLWSRYKVILVMIPSLIGIHYGWVMLQVHPPLPDQPVKPIKLFGYELNMKREEKLTDENN